MWSTSELAPFTTLDWAVCERYECYGAQVMRQTCLSHLSTEDRASYFRGLAPGSHVDHRGTAFDSTLLSQLLVAVGRHLKNARFDAATFSGPADFSNVTFDGEASFHATGFHENVDFSKSKFGNTPQLGPLYCRTSVNLAGAVFQAPVTIKISASQVRCIRTHWESTATLRLRYALLDLEDAVLDQPMAVSASLLPFRGDERTEAMTTFGSDPAPRQPKLLSIAGVDAAQLVITDLDLSQCMFTGAFHLDQINFNGDNKFAEAPTGIVWNIGIPTRWTPRRMLAEEHYWRHDAASSPRARNPWRQNPTDLHVINNGPRHIAASYRHLRKALEDGKNEPDAADFYYGEMEMRRHDNDRPRAERVLINAYWALSGYGLRASRALGWLLIAMVLTIFMMMGWGLPQSAPQPDFTGTLSQGRIKLTTDTPDPVDPKGWPPQLTSDRWEKSLRVVVNSVIFRSSSDDLTTFGTYTEMASRIAEPVLLGLAVLAIRGRVKR
ncbi:pentapeptide repeat-containing protein [Streptomyces sp. NPDC008317]|uniref:pentapeptide repeat-containing protein n=1 Tax=Streptomyces sp. NPDC008317 TaxID=3364827 RepID=UPI0036EC1BA8